MMNPQGPSHGLENPIEDHPRNRLRSCLLRLLAGLDHWIGLVEAQVLSWGVMLMAANTIANVFGRYFFNQSLYFTEELNQFLIVIITFMGLGYVTRKGRHIRMSAFYDMLGNRPKKLLMVLIAAVTAVVMLLLAWYAFEYVAKVARRGRVTPALQLPLYLTYVWVVVGFLVTAIQYLLCMVKNLQLEDPEVYISFTTVDRYEDPEIAEVLHLYNQDHDRPDHDRPDQDSPTCDAPDRHREGRDHGLSQDARPAAQPSSQNRNEETPS